MPRTNRKTNRSSLEKIEIRTTPSEYREGSWSRVAAIITFRLHGTQVSSLEERSALAVAHRVAADLLEAMPPDGAWCSPAAEVVTSYRDIAVVKVELELCDGTAAEAERARALLAQVTAELK